MKSPNFIRNYHGLRTPREEIALTALPRIQSQSQIFRYGRSIFCLPHRPNFSDIFDLCLHWVSVVRGNYLLASYKVWTFSHIFCPWKNLWTLTPVKNLTVNRILSSLPTIHFKDIDNTFGTLTLSNQATLHKTGWHHAFALDLSYFLHSVWFTRFGSRNCNNSLLFDATRNRKIDNFNKRVQNYPQWYFKFIYIVLY